MKPASVRKGDVVEIRFDDHVEQDDRLADITVFGRVVTQNARMIVVETWAPTDRAAKRDREQNDYHTFTIAKGAVRSIWKLGRVDNEKRRR